MSKRLIHRGLHRRRLVDNNPRELAFSDAWAKECERRPGTDHGWGILQDLMFLHSDKPRRGFWRYFGPFGNGFRRVAFIIRRRDAVIAATVVQWFGSNCGMCFLETALRKCGYRIVREAEWNETLDRAYASAGGAGAKGR